MKKGYLLVSTMVLSALLLTGCGQEAQNMTADVESSLQTLEYEEVGEISDELAAGINQFALELFKRQPENDNMFFSPYSIAQAISILNVGAGGETKQEMETMLGIVDMDSWNQQMKAFMNQSWSEDTKLLTANSLWVNPAGNWAENVDADFFAPTKIYYNCETFEADFANNFDQISKQITKWVDENTQGMIPDYKTISNKDTAMSIINAVYFEGKWEHPFKGEDTKADGAFWSKNKEWERDIPMMKQWNVDLRYFETTEFQGVELPYKDSSLAMDILLPKTNEVAFYHELTIEEQVELWDKFDTAEVKTIDTLQVPAFTMDLSIDGLVDILMDMGMVSAFSETADLDKIGQDQFVSNIAHRAKIEVFEEGTRAAAVTEIITMESCVEVAPDIVTFIVDSPFIYVIRDTESGVILFMGQVTSLK